MPDAPTPEAEAIAREIQRAGLTGDRLLAPALSAFLRGVLRIEAAATRLGDGLGAILAGIADAKRAEPLVSDQAMREAGRGVMQHAARGLALAYPWAAGGALVLALGVGFGAGYGVRAAQPVDTAIGPLPPDALRAFRACDLGAAWRNAREVKPSGGGTARWVACWDEPPPIR